MLPCCDGEIKLYIYNHLRLHRQIRCDTYDSWFKRVKRILFLRETILVCFLHDVFITFLTSSWFWFERSKRLQSRNCT